MDGKANSVLKVNFWGESPLLLISRHTYNKIKSIMARDMHSEE